MNSSTKLYWMILLLCLTGYVWLGYNLVDRSHSQEFTVCTFKTLTGVPCISCGTTRSVQEIFHGHLAEAVLINPLGFIAAIFLLAAPVWIFIDLFRKSESFYVFYKKAEVKIKTKAVYIPLITLGLLNWCWNIMKGV